MVFEFNVLDKKSLDKLYTEFNFRDTDIAEIVGVSADAILKKRKKYEIPSRKAHPKKLDVKIIYTGKKKNKRNDLTNNLLVECCQKGLTDKEIGQMFNMTGEGVAYRRKKIGIEVNHKNTKLKRNISELRSTSKEELEKDYYGMTNPQFSSKYGVSRIVWLPYLRSLGIIDKNEHRIKNYPPLNKKQKCLIIGGMLGDGGISESGCYYEFHSKKQSEYLKFKQRCLNPYSNNVIECEEGFQFKTVSHPNIKVFRTLFYKDNVPGKLIPLDFIKKYWDDSILAYWFFDDGNYDETANHFWIGNNCSSRKQLDQLVDFLNYAYRFNCYVTLGSGVYIVNFPVNSHEKFVEILFKVITPDLYYKIPEKFLTKDMVEEIDLDVTVLRPKFYRLASKEKQNRMVELAFRHYRKKGFPYSLLSDKRKEYLLQRHLNVKPLLKGHDILFKNSGMILCESFFPNMYDCFRKGYESPVESWNCDHYLKKLIINRFKYAKLLSDSTMRVGIKLSRAAVSNFKPIIAKFLYQKYCFNGKVLDYSSGFGSRLLAARSLGLEYVGYEPSEKTYNNLLKFNKFLSNYCKGKSLLYNSSFEDSDIFKKYFSFAFSSPPYFDYENYGEEKSQSINKYPVYSEWLKYYWEYTVDKCLDSLLYDGRFAYCLSIDLCQDMMKKADEVCEKRGFYIETFFRAPFKDVFNRKDRFEIIVVYSKNNKGLKLSDILESFNNISENNNNNSNFFYEKKGIKKRRAYRKEDIGMAISIFKNVYQERGTSRRPYQDGKILGIPAHVLEKKYGSWNNFIKKCGLTPEYEAKSPKEHVETYLKNCLEQNTVLSFLDFQKLTGNHKGRLKRLFDKGKKYHHLKESLKEVALKQELWPDFLKNFE